MSSSIKVLYSYLSSFIIFFKMNFVDWTCGNFITHYVKGQKKVCVWRQSQWKQFNENFNSWVLGFEGIFELSKFSKSVHSSMWCEFFSSWSWLPSPPLAVVDHRPSPLNSPPCLTGNSHISKRRFVVTSWHVMAATAASEESVGQTIISSHRPPSLTHTLCIQGLVIFCNLQLLHYFGCISHRPSWLWLKFLGLTIGDQHVAACGTSHQSICFSHVIVPSDRQKKKSLKVCRACFLHQLIGL